MDWIMIVLILSEAPNFSQSQSLPIPTISPGYSDLISPSIPR